MRKRTRKATSPVPNTKRKFEVLPDSSHKHTVETPYGTIVYTYVPETISSILRGIFTTLLGRVYYNKPLDFQRLIETPENEPPYRYLFTAEPSLLAEQEKHSEYAYELLQQQAPHLLVEASEQLIKEVIFRTLYELQDQSQYKLNSKISELLKLLTNDIIEGVKLRVNAPSQGGRNPEWTPERMESFLVIYEDALKTLKDAKRIYKQNKNTGKKGNDKWKAMVAAAYPQLPDRFINLLESKGKTAEPHMLAYEYAAELFNVEFNEYVPKVLSEARKQRREKRTVKRVV